MSPLGTLSSLRGDLIKVTKYFEKGINDVTFIKESCLMTRAIRKEVNFSDKVKNGYVQHLEVVERFENR